MSTKTRGFASLDPKRRKEIASMGGKAAHASGMAHEFTSGEARAAAKKRHAANRQQARDSGRRVPQDDEAHECLDQLD